MALLQNNIYLVNLDTEPRQRLRIQTVPNVLEVDPVSNWAAVPSVGRNNPFYHFTGGENVLKFEIDWYSRTVDRFDVIKACRWVESLTRNNGVNKAPRVLLIWGDLFKRSSWIVEKAPYQLKNFEIGNGTLPTQAYQRVTLKRVMPLGQNTLIESTVVLDGLSPKSPEPLFASPAAPKTLSPV